MNMGRNGSVRLPPGFRFHPTDEELVDEYLKRKIMNRPLPASVILDFDVCRSDPWDLPGEKGKERYYFSTREAKYPNGNRSNRATNSGYWKATGKDKAVVGRSSNINSNSRGIIGMKKTLVFYKGKPPHGSRTDWIMHEYRLLPSLFPLKTGDWVLCRIFLKKRNNAGNKTDREEDEPQQEIVCDEQDEKLGVGRFEHGITMPVFYDFLARDTTTNQPHLNLTLPCSSSSGSSAVTEISSNDDIQNNDNNNNDNKDESVSEDREQSSSCCNSVSSSLSLRSL